MHISAYLSTSLQTFFLKWQFFPITSAVEVFKLNTLNKNILKSVESSHMWIFWSLKYYHISSKENHRQSLIKVTEFAIKNQIYTVTEGASCFSFKPVIFSLFSPKTSTEIQLKWIILSFFAFVSVLRISLFHWSLNRNLYSVFSYLLLITAYRT